MTLYATTVERKAPVATQKVSDFRKSPEVKERQLAD